MVGHTAAAGHASPTWCSTTPRSSRHCRTTRIDAAGLVSLDELTTARNTPGICIRRAPAPSWYHFTFNGAPGSILADKNLRLAVAKGIDRQAIADVTQRGLVDKPAAAEQPHLRRRPEGLPGQQRRGGLRPGEGQGRNSTRLGWRINGQFREKDGRQLVIRDVLYDAQTRRSSSPRSRRTASRRSASSSNSTPRAAAASSPTTSSPATSTSPSSRWVGDAFPLCCLTQIYTTRRGKQLRQDQQLRRSTPRSSRRSTSSTRPRPATLANELDKMIWAEAVSACRCSSRPATSRCAAPWRTYGPAGIGDLDYTKIGFMK